MTLSHYESQLANIESQIYSLQHTTPIPAVLTKAIDLAETRDRIRITISELKDALRSVEEQDYDMFEFA